MGSCSLSISLAGAGFGDGDIEVGDDIDTEVLDNGEDDWGIAPGLIGTDEGRGYGMEE